MNAQHTDRKIGLGWNADGGRVVAHISVEPQTGVTQYTDHHEGADPDRVSVSFDVVGPGSEWHGGQVPAEDRVIVRRHDNDADEATETFINELWATHHLNDMNAACDHMTPEMLARHEGESTHDWQTRMLDTVTCPETGYRWGRAWLAKAVPADVLDKARQLISNGRLS